MRIIISPAKKMNVDVDTLAWQDLPQFLPQAQELLTLLQQMTYEELKKLWCCNDKLALLNYNRLKNMDLTEHLTPAILSYEGIQYQHMAPGVFTYDEYDYIQKHLRILSGFYGILKPFDGVTPYRLEMQARLSVNEKSNLYDFWGDRLTKHLESETNIILNLASYEYSKIISKHLSPHTQMITCTFGEWKNGKIIEKGTLCKMARGEMVRFMAENKIKKPEEIKTFQRLSFQFQPEFSNDAKYVFIR